MDKPLTRKGHSLFRLQNRLYLFGGSDLHEHNDIYRLDQVLLSDLPVSSSSSHHKKPTISLNEGPKVTLDLSQQREWREPGWKILGCDAPCSLSVSVVPERLASPLRPGEYKIVYFLSPSSDASTVIDKATRIVQVIAGVRTIDANKLRLELSEITERVSSISPSSFGKELSSEETELLGQLQEYDQKLHSLRQQIDEIEENIRKMQLMKEQVKARESTVIEIQSKREEFVTLVDQRENQVNTLTELHSSVSEEIDQAEGLLSELETIEAKIDDIHSSLSSLSSSSNALDSPEACDSSESLLRFEIEKGVQKVEKLRSSLKAFAEEEKTLQEQIDAAQEIIDRENEAIQKTNENTADARASIADLEQRLIATNNQIQRLTEEGLAFSEKRAHLDQLHNILKSSTWSDLEKVLDSVSQLEGQAARLLGQLSEKDKNLGPAATVQEIEDKKNELKAKTQRLSVVTDTLEDGYEQEYQQWNARLTQEKRDKDDLLAELSKLLEKVKEADLSIDNHNKLVVQTQALLQSRSSALLNARQRVNDVQTDAANEQEAVDKKRQDQSDLLAKCKEIRIALEQRKDERAKLLDQLSVLETQQKTVGEKLVSTLSHLDVQTSKMSPQVEALLSSSRRVSEKLSAFRLLQRQERSLEI